MALGILQRFKYPHVSKMRISLLVTIRLISGLTEVQSLGLCLKVDAGQISGDRCIH